MVFKMLMQYCSCYRGGELNDYGSGGNDNGQDNVASGRYDDGDTMIVVKRITFALLISLMTLYNVGLTSSI
jgi:hypothetical protein